MPSFRKSTATLLVSLAPFFAPGAHAADAKAGGNGGVTLDQHIKPMLEQYCFDCHNDQKTKGDVNLVDVSKTFDLKKDHEVWEKVLESVEKGDMPPEKKPQPSDQQREMLLHFLDGQVSKVDCTVEKDPGRVTIRRLNREEYRRTIHQLLGVDYNADDFPNDEVGFGFDNIADVLSLSPLLMEKYMDAAETVVGQAIVSGPGKPIVKKWMGTQLERKGNSLEGSEDGTLVFASTVGTALAAMDFPGKGEYKVRLRAFADQAGKDVAKASVRMEGGETEVLDIAATSKKPGVYEVTLSAEKGWHKVEISFLNDYYDDKNSDPKLRGDRNLYVKSVEIEIPPGEATLPESHRRLITRMPAPGEEAKVARELLAPFLKKAYRRPVTAAEVDQIARFVDLALANKGSFLEGMQVAVQAALSSPQFLFRWEIDPPKTKAPTRELTDYELACRLSYFLWSSMPDDELFALADKGVLRKDGNLEKQIVRMLKDWKARALVNNFADQWLQIRGIWEVQIDPATFPKFSDDLKGLMKEETERFFEAIMKEDRNVRELLDADYTFLNEKLARYYGIEGVQGGEFRKVTLPAGSPRGGVITQGSVLLATSTPTRTSPVIRGKWILEQILGTPPPAAPAGVPPLPEQNRVSQTASLRQRLGEHMKNPECASCHKRMDPLGFALENFDATGAWRDKDGKFPIDASGKIPSGDSFNGAKELKAVLKKGDHFVANLAEKLLIYALGRGLDYNDRCAIKHIVERTNKSDGKFSQMIAGIVLSDPFQKRKTDPISQQ